MHLPWQAPRIIISKVYGAQQMAKTQTIMASDLAIFLSLCSFDLAFVRKEAEKSFLRGVGLIGGGDGQVETSDGLNDLVNDETLSSISNEDDTSDLGKKQDLQDELLLLGGSESCMLPRLWRRWMLLKMCTLK